MAGYTSDSLVNVRPFESRRDGDTVTIGDVERQVFLAIPAEALDILESLKAGCTVGEAARRYEEKHHEEPDVEDFLEVLEAEGFVGDTAPAVEEPGARKAMRRSWNLDGLSVRTAQRLVGWPVMAVFALIFIAGTAAQVDDITIMPTPAALFYPEHFGLLTWATFAGALFGVTVHEFGHVIAARAAGIPSRIGLGNQMYFLVATTDMTGIWLAPKRRRYVAFMIGSILDLVSYSLLAILQWMGRNGIVELPRWGSLLITGVMLTYSTRVVWQWFFFLRTDGYYVVSTLLNCKNLMVDTQDYLRNLMAAVLRRPGSRVDQSAVPRREMRVVRFFALFWLSGRAVFLSLLVFVGIPLLWSYLGQAVMWALGRESKLNSFDFATIVILAFLIDGGGVAMWLRGLYRNARDRRRQRLLKLRAREEATAVA